MTSVLLLGSTGSIGTQTLELIRSPGSGVEVVGLAAGSSWEALLEQAREFGVSQLALADPQAAEQARAHLPQGATLHQGPEAVEALVAATEFDIAVHGIVGCAGLPASIAVLRRGKRLALANKESLVVAGQHLMALAQESGGEILPVDSEHSAVVQCLRGEDLGRVRKVLLTCSGGPFRETPAEDLPCVTPEQALRHPNWSMGPRITVGSATLMNKALEVIELHHLFGLEPDRIEVVIHPQSVVHSMVEFVDGAVIAHMGPPDMRGPIHYALHAPDRAPSPLKGFDFQVFRQLEFDRPDLDRFPALQLGFDCVSAGADAACALNAADEVAVEAFLAGRIAFTHMDTVHRTALKRRTGRADSIEELMAADALARSHAAAAVETLSAQHTSAPAEPAT